MSITDTEHVTTTVTTCKLEPPVLVPLPRGARSLHVVAHSVEIHQRHGADGRQVFISGPFRRADGTQGAWQQHRLDSVPADLAVLVDEACAGVAL